MDLSRRRLSIQEVKSIDMVGYLSSLGHKPAKVKGSNYWYLSPLREEKTPSFKINVNLNRWYDFGLGKGGSLIDFCILYFGSTIPEIIQNLSAGFLPSPSVAAFVKKTVENTTGKICVLDEFELTSFALISYLRQRGITVELASRYCKEIRYRLYDKTWYGIGFKNDLGGYEIRNKYFKSGSSPKAITTIPNNSSQVSIFEGFFDFLSYLSLRVRFNLPETDYLILNSLSFFHQTLPILEEYDSIYLYLDKTPAGQKCSAYALSLGSNYKDKSCLYKGFDDLNDFLLYGIIGNNTENLPKPRPP